MLVNLGVSMAKIDLTQISIEKGVPLPAARNKTQGATWEKFISGLEVGDSFVVPNEKVAGAMYGYFKRLGFKAAIREIESGFCRVWRSA